jgi:hypothetical protein
MDPKTVTSTITTITDNHLLAGNHLHLVSVALPVVHLHPLLALTITTITLTLPMEGDKDRLVINNVMLVNLDMVLLLLRLIMTDDVVMVTGVEDIKTYV